MLKFQEEPLEVVEAELRGILREHWKEVALDQDSIELEPDWKKYRELAKQGVFSIVTARDDGVLVGYYAAFIHGHLHYKRSLTAFCDIFFLKPAYRKGRYPLRLFQAHEKAMKARGVQKIYTMHKLHVNDIGDMLKYMGYRHIENIYAKVLED